MRAGLILAVSVVSAGLGGLAAGGEEAEMVDLSWVENIRASFPIPASKEDVDSCIVGDESPCDLSSFTKDRSTVVYPGGDTRCIFSSSTPFGPGPPEAFEPLAKHPAIERLLKSQPFYSELMQFLDNLMDDYGLQEPSIDIPIPVDYPRDKL